MARPTLPDTLIARAASGLYGVQLGAGTMDLALSLAAPQAFGSVDALLNSLYTADFGSKSDADVASTLVTNLGITDANGADAGLVTAAESYVAMVLGAAPADGKGAAVLGILSLFSQLTDDPDLGRFAQAYNNQTDQAIVYYQNNNGDLPISSVVPAFSLMSETVAGLETMRLTGNMDVRIQLTNPANQITGLDLNGDGVITANGIENNSASPEFESVLSSPATGFAVVDAYARNPLNNFDTANNFLGDIAFDGTGFKGDGTKTNGNIFLGGLGADRALGGIGNDFLAGGGIAQGNGGHDYLSGGRNADFFFVELSQLSSTDGNDIRIDGGTTADDTVAATGTPGGLGTQDNDWILLEASDDDEPVRIDLNENGSGGPNGFNADGSTASGQVFHMWDIESVNASGNLYKFLDDVDTVIGSRSYDGYGDAYAAGEENYGRGSTAQLDITGSEANNAIIGGYDNDSISGEGGNDLLMGGDLQYLITHKNNPNLLDDNGGLDLTASKVGIVTNGIDILDGGDGNDNIVFEADGGQILGGGDTGKASGNVGGVDDRGYAGPRFASQGDTLWLTDFSMGRLAGATLDDEATAQTDALAALTTDSTFRVDLGTGNAFKNYGGAVTKSQDTTNYATDAAARPTVSGIESVNTTGLGAIDYKAAGTNLPDVTFANQQNYYALNATVDLRGTGADNALLANTGNDTVEGRGGDDVLSGGTGNDTLVVAFGDGVDWVARPVDANGDNLWDTAGGLVVAGGLAWGQDFRPPQAATAGTTTLVVDFGTTVLNGSTTFVATFQMEIDGEVFGADIPVAELAAAKSTAEVASIVNASYSATNPNVSVVATSPTTIEVRAVDSTPEDGVLPVIGTTSADGFFVTGQASGVGTYQAKGTVLGTSGTDLEDDRIIIKSYEDRSINLGVNQAKVETSQAADMVVNFTATGSQLAEGQGVRLYLDGVKEGDIVTVDVNGAKYSYKAKAGENSETVATNLAAAITNFLDVNSASGQITPTASLNSFGDAKDLGGDQAGLLIQQAVVLGSQVFMNISATVTRDDGVGAFGTVAGHNQSDTMIQLLGFDGRNGALFSQDPAASPVVLFQGRNTGVTTTSLLLTAKDAGGDLKGSDANMVPFDPLNDPGAGNRWINGDDLLIGGLGNDNILAGTGDDVILMSAGKDTVDGGGNITAVKNVSYGENFQDVLIAQEGTFGTGTSFTVTLDGTLNKNGAGTVAASTGATTTFTNMELVRVLENNRNSSLDLKALSDNIALAVGDNSIVAEGLDVLLTRNPSTKYTIDDNNNGAIVASEIRTTTAVLGTENITTGNSNDRVTLDQTQATANNKIDLGAQQDNTVLATLRKGQDTVTYDHRDINNDGAIDVLDLATQKPTITVAVTGVGASSVSMTAGALGAAKTTDTLVGVEVLNVTNAATGALFNDTIDVSGLSGAVINYGGDVAVGKSQGGQNAPVTTVAQLDANTLDAGGIALASKLGAELQVITGVTLMERVIGSAGDDRVIVGNAMQAVAADQFKAADIDRVTGLQVDLTTVTGISATKAQLPDQGLYQFDLGAGSNDSVDYFDELGDVRVSVDTTGTAPDWVIVDARIDYASGVERFFGGDGANWIDLAAASVATTIQFSKESKINTPANEFGEPNGNDGTNTTGNTNTAEVRSTADNTVFASFVDRVGTNVTGTEAWLNVQGGNLAETVNFTDNETALAHTLNLAGGLNRVDYTALTATVTAAIGAVNTGLASLPQDSNANGDDIQQLRLADSAANALTIVGSSRSGDIVDVSGLVAGRVVVSATPVPNTSEVDPQLNVVDLTAGKVTESLFGQYSPVGSTAAVAAAFPTFVSGFENATNQGSFDVVHLLGDGGRNSLTGGNGDDLIFGGRGTAGDGSADVGFGNRGDLLTGNKGADTFLYRAETESPAGAIGVQQLGSNFGNDADNVINSVDTITDFTPGADLLAFVVPDSYSSVKVTTALPANLATPYKSADPAAIAAGATTTVTIVNDPTLASVPARADDYAIDFTPGGAPTLADIVLRVTASSGSDTIDASAGLAVGNLNAAAGDLLAVQVVYTAASQSQAGGFDTIVNFTTGEDLIDLSFLKLPRYESTYAANGVDFDTNDNQVVDALEGGFGAVRALGAAPLFSVNGAAPGLFIDAGVYKPVATQTLLDGFGDPSTTVFIDANGDGNYIPSDDMVLVLVGVTAPASGDFVFDQYGGGYGG